MEKKKLGWYASGKERVPGRLLIYAFISLAAVLFAAVTLTFFGLRVDIGGALLRGLVAAVIALAAGLIIWLIYTRLIVKK